jgi:23S rRNA pseudouridine1911/1915/1917 synthase
VGRALDRNTAERRERLVVTEDGRADAVIAAALPGLSRSRIQRLIEAGAVSVDGSAVKKSTLLQAGQRVSVDVPGGAPATGRAPSADLPLLYEDDDLLVIDKPPSVIVHAAPGDSSPTVAAWFAARHAALSAHLDPDRPGIVHRLDRDTTGVLVLGKSPEAVAFLSQAFEDRTVHKTYLAVCEGDPNPPEAIIDAPIARHPADRGRMGVVRDGSGREARTRYETIGTAAGRSLLLVEPESGRTHQVRVHLAAIGVPVLFDPLYGAPGEGRHQLHAWRLVLPHPAGGSLTVSAPMPPDMAALVRSMGLHELASGYATAHPPQRSPE